MHIWSLLWWEVAADGFRKSTWVAYWGICACWILFVSSAGLFSCLSLFSQTFPKGEKNDKNLTKCLFVLHSDEVGIKESYMCPLNGSDSLGWLCMILDLKVITVCMAYIILTRLPLRLWGEAGFEKCDGNQVGGEFSLNSGIVARLSKSPHYLAGFILRWWVFAMPKAYCWLGFQWLKMLMEIR